MKKALIQLMKVKTLVTLVLSGVFAYLCISGQVNTEQFMTVFAVVIAFYFGTQAEKSKNTLNYNNEESKNE